MIVFHSNRVVVACSFNSFSKKYFAFDILYEDKVSTFALLSLSNTNLSKKGLS